MNWIAFVVIAYVCVGLELGLRPILDLGGGGAPSFVVPLMVFVALGAPHVATLWAALALGLLIDLTSPLAFQERSGEAWVIGPYAIGYVLAAQVMLSLRGVVVRKHPLTLAGLALVASLVIHVCVTFLHSIRSAYDPIAWDLSAQLVSRLFSSLWTALSALAMWAVLSRVSRFMEFQAPGAWAASQRRVF